MVPHKEEYRDQMDHTTIHGTTYEQYHTGSKKKYNTSYSHRSPLSCLIRLLLLSKLSFHCSAVLKTNILSVMYCTVRYVTFLTVWYQIVPCRVEMTIDGIYIRFQWQNIRNLICRTCAKNYLIADTKREIPVWIVFNCSRKRSFQFHL